MPLRILLYQNRTGRKYATALILTISLIQITCGTCFAAENRALLVAIGTYIKPGEINDNRPVWIKEPIPDLKSPLNDAALFKAMLTRRFNYTEENIQELHNKEATRTNIYNALINHLELCNTGDHFTFYYSGHGSRLRNSLSPEPDKLDEAIVPADGIFYNSYLRDKELALIFQKFIERGVVLTVIIDSCHSGSMARGAETEIKAVGAPETDLNDPMVYPQPETQGAVVLSAAQDYQQAAGSKDENGIWTSYFTRTLTRIINDETQHLTAAQIFDAVTATMRYRSYRQIPVMAANESRRESTLFGERLLKRKYTYPALGLIDRKRIQLAGGPATGIEEGAVLLHAASGTELTVESIAGINTSVCLVTKGDMFPIPPGTSFELIRRGGAGTRNALRVSISQQMASDGITEIPSHSSARQVTDSLTLLLQSEYQCAEVTAEDDADYILKTSLNNNQTEFQLIRNPLMNDPFDPYPDITGSYPVHNEPMQTAAKIASDICRLSRMKGWLTIESSMEFPYQLQIRRNNEKTYQRGGECKEGDFVEVVLNQNQEPDTTSKAYVYVFGIDSNGKTVLLYPLGGSNVENYLPLTWRDTSIPVSAFRVGQPLGTDHLILLASATPIMNPSLIQQESINSRGISENYIDQLVSGIYQNSRGAALQQDKGYYVDRITLISRK
jgi:hypothetical protein